jgi:hypothetical protein
MTLDDVVEFCYFENSSYTIEGITIERQGDGHFP